MSDDDPLKGESVGAPRGRPFHKGHDIGKETRFQPGVSGNLNGRPRKSRAFRRKARQRAWTISQSLMNDVESGETIDIGKVKLLEFFANRGGFLPADRIINAETQRLKLLLEVLQMDNIDDDKKGALLAAIAGRMSDILAESTENPAPKLLEAKDPDDGP